MVLKKASSLVWTNSFLAKTIALTYNYAVLTELGLGTHIKLPASVADLATGLTNVDGNTFALK